MDLRSRSRSKTPYLTDSSFEKEVNKIGNRILERTVTTRSTRSGTRVTNEDTKITNIGQNFDSITTVIPKQSANKMKSTRSERTLRSSRYKTSDYSSEDGENDVSTSHTVDQNVQNQLIEEARKRRSASNSSSASHISALDVYRAAGEYWNKYPKTDWTYSRSSKDRIEIAPGVIAMPNMSRRSIHSNDSNSDYLSDKQTNTSFSLEETVDEGNGYRRKYYSDNYSSKIKPRTLFSRSNNNNNNQYVSSRSSATTHKNVFYRFSSVFTSIFFTIFNFISTIGYVLYNTHNAVYVWFGKKIHKFVSRIMLIDTWLLQSVNTKKKISSLLALCLLPLLLLGGWWLLSGLSYTLYNNFVNLTNPAITTSKIAEKFTVDTQRIIKRDAESQKEEYHDLGSKLEKAVTIKKKIVVEHPSASEIAAELSEEQLEEIGNLLKDKLHNQENVIIEKILRSPSMQNIINAYNELNVKVDANEKSYYVSKIESDIHIDSELFERQRKAIEDLESDVRKMKAEFLMFERNQDKKLSLLISQLKAENMQNKVKLLYELKRCCRNSFVQMENYVGRILGKLLGAPHLLTNEKDISKWLHSMFVAKNDLESRLANLTQNLKSNFDHLIENSGHVIMDDVTTKISDELHDRLEKLEQTMQQKDFRGELTVDTLTDEYVKGIVKEVLEIYDADKTGLVDYAMEPSGGQVLSTRCSETYHAGTAVISVLGIPLWYPTNTPRTVITPGVNPGECWAFQNFPGFLVIKLAAPIKIDAFSYEHISKKLMPNGKIDSALKDFAVYGLKNETDTEPILIGTYHYDHDGPSLQYFAAESHGLTFEIIELRVFSNHGNPNYTCLYRFRVHGTVTDNPT
ncbi:SUN domain-containing protein 2 [Agrilus planipennis]|uniref:SUN domain-containing protein 2 n=1 Tax=Agrilus planipennis TaxID=224129 RepID=A0A7F5RMC3_AGRPL|nr:SUN domain-containing protein 2 [Agrilus planipennis]